MAPHLCTGEQTQVNIEGYGKEEEEGGEEEIIMKLRGDVVGGISAKLRVENGG